MHSQDNSELMRRMVEVFNTGDTSVVELVVSPNYVDHQESEVQKYLEPMGSPMSSHWPGRRIHSSEWRFKNLTRKATR